MSEETKTVIKRIEPLIIGEIISDRVDGADFGVGDILRFGTRFNFDENILEVTSSRMAPTLIVTEVVKESLNNKKIESYIEYPEKLDVIKYKCQWFSRVVGRLNEEWFYQSQLTQVSDRRDIKELEFVIKMPLVKLANNNEEKKERQIQINTITVQDVPYNSGEFKTKERRIKDSNFIDFSSSKMMVIEVKRNRHDSPLQKISRDGEIQVVRQIPLKLVKCKWFETKDNKFSEKYIPATSLSGVNLPKKKVEQ